MSNRVVAAVAGAAVVLGGFTSMPLLAIATGGGTPGCARLAGQADGSPTILGPSTLTVTDLQAWWDGTGKGQPAQLHAEVADVVALYLSEGDLEGVRGDLAFAQAIVETGYFTSGDTARNNYAGIAHYDHTTRGRAFDSPSEGVRAQIQLMKKFAAGNDIALARPDVAPNAGAHADTWAGLVGTWATDPGYWSAISSVYRAMLDSAAAQEPTGVLAPAPACPPGGGQDVVGGYALPVDRHWYDEHPDWFSKPHHDYPAADIPVPLGTPVYSMAAGTVAGTPASGRCGIGVVVDGDDGAQYIYCHGQPASPTVTVGARVEAGQQLMLSASTGNSTGPHLHLGIRISGQNRCPQPLLVSIAEGAPVDVATLPSSGCIS